MVYTKKKSKKKNSNGDATLYQTQFRHFLFISRRSQQNNVNEKGKKNSNHQPYYIYYICTCRVKTTKTDENKI